MAGLGSLWALEGWWSLERAIVHADGRENRLMGNVHFHRDGARLIMDESGALELGAQVVAASRRYIWAEGAAGLDVFFDDMRAFHSVALHVAQHHTVHLCEPDRYEVDYDFTDWPSWSVRWAVKGPRKDYVMASHLSPKSTSLAP